MKMFDHININIPCPICGHIIDNFQSKDKHCMMKLLEFWEVDNFYSSCINCGSRIEYKLNEKSRKKFTLEDYFILIKLPKLINNQEIKEGELK